ncbi:hypothetical protein L1887_03208 [Cichorium endivia]|nr:hypothetical protein L1887_03208 [Cichorium endivia]
MMLQRTKMGPNLVPDLGLGRMVQDGLIFRQNVYIRSYEVGPDGKALVETLMHLVQLDSQEATANSMKTVGLMFEGFGSAEMSKKNLIWVMLKMQMIVDRYPTWGDILQIDICKVPYGKNGVCCNITFCDCKTGEILVRASSIWVMMNKKTRKLSRFPNEVRTILEQYFMDTPPIVVQNTGTWSEREDNFDEHICKGLKSVPKTVMGKYEIDSMTLEYYRECTKDSVLQSITSILVNRNGEIGNFDVDCQHLLQHEKGGGNGNVMKGTTRWRLKHGKSQDSGAC